MTNLVYVYYVDGGYNADSLPMYYYKGTHVPEKGATYRVEVDYLDYAGISAETYIPEDVILFNIQVDTISDNDKIGLDFSFEDDPYQQNYYRLKMFSSCKKEWENYEEEIEEIDYKKDIYFMSNDPSFPGGIPFDGYTFAGDNVVFSDVLFDAVSYTHLTLPTIYSV